MWRPPPGRATGPGKCTRFSFPRVSGPAREVPAFCPRADAGEDGSCSLRQKANGKGGRSKVRRSRGVRETVNRPARPSRYPGKPPGDSRPVLRRARARARARWRRASMRSRRKARGLRLTQRWTYTRRCRRSGHGNGHGHADSGAEMREWLRVAPCRGCHGLATASPCPSLGATSVGSVLTSRDKSSTTSPRRSGPSVVWRCCRVVRSVACRSRSRRRSNWEVPNGRTSE